MLQNLDKRFQHVIVSSIHTSQTLRLSSTNDKQMKYLTPLLGVAALTAGLNIYYHVYCCIDSFIINEMISTYSFLHTVFGRGEIRKRERGGREVGER